MLAAVVCASTALAVPRVARSARMCADPVSEKPVFVLDFDGVLCDAREAVTKSAWRTALELWPEPLEAAAELGARAGGVRKAWGGGDWSALEGHDDEGMPNWLSAKMRQLRPTVHAGYESVLLARLCAEEALASTRNERGSRPLSAGEIQEGWEFTLRDSCLVRYGISQGISQVELDEAYARTCDAWAAESRSSWKEAHKLYAPEALRRCADSGAAELYVLTNGPPTTAREVLGSERVMIDDDHVIGLTETRSKPEALLEVQARHAESPLRLVEDAADSVRLVAADVRLLRWRIYYAHWGHTTPAQEAITSAFPRVRHLQRSAELEPLLLGADAS